MSIFERDCRGRAGYSVYYRVIGGAAHEFGSDPPDDLPGRAEDVMRAEVLTVDVDAPLAEVAAKMVDEQIHRLLVLESGKLVGVISALDIVASIAVRPE